MKIDRFDVEYNGPLERDRKTLQGAFAAFLKALVESLIKPNKENDMSEDKTTFEKTVTTVEPVQPKPIPTPKPAPQPPPTLPPVVPTT